MTKLIFTQNVIGSRFNVQPSNENTDKLVCTYGWTSAKGQQEIEYSVEHTDIPKDNLEAKLAGMPYVTEELTTTFYSEQIYDNDGEPAAEPCILHDFNIGKFDELNLFFRVHGNADEIFRVKFPIDPISKDTAKAIKAGSQWFVRID